MKDLYNKAIGKKWGELSDDIRNELLKNCNCVDGITGNDTENGECIVDLTDNLSVSGFIKDFEELIINDDAVIYDPAN